MSGWSLTDKLEWDIFLLLFKLFTYEKNELFMEFIGYGFSCIL